MVDANNNAGNCAGGAPDPNATLQARNLAGGAPAWQVQNNDVSPPAAPAPVSWMVDIT